MAFNKFNLIAPIFGLGAIAVVTTSSISSLESTKLITIYFYDKSSTEKKIRFSIESLSPSSMEIWDSDKWTRNISTSDKTMYNKLFNIGHKFIKTQGNLNIIKFNKSMENAIEKAKKCCCKKNCNCKDKKCAMCVCCLSEDQKCCCQNNAACTWDEFKKTQQTFAYLLSETYSGRNNIYLNPIESHIRFPDLDFSNLTSETSETSEKSFIGSLTYGFVDYWYKPVKYKNIIPTEKTSELNNLEENKDYYFTNVPQIFWFNSTNTNTKENNIDKAFNETNNPSNILKKIQEENTGSSTDDLCCCPDNKLSCLIERNFVVKHEQKNKMSDIIKNANCEQSQ